MTETALQNKTVLIVCGSRTFKNETLVFETLESVPGLVGIIEGGASGADAFGKNFALASGTAFRTFVADWNQYGKRAGYLRNKAMLEELLRLQALGYVVGVSAFIDKPFEESRGTSMMVDLAEKAGVQTWVERSDQQ